MQDRDWKWAVQEGLGGTGQLAQSKEMGEAGAQSCCSGLDAIPGAAERLQILQKALIPREHPQNSRDPH